MKKKGKRRGTLFPSQRRGAQYGSFRTFEGRNEELSLHFEDLQHVFVVRFAQRFHEIFARLGQSAEEDVLKIFKVKAKLLISTLKGSEAAVLGASALGWE